MENKELEALKEKYADFIAGLSEEEKAKVEACKTVEELTVLVKNAEGVLPDEIVEAVAGGKDEGEIILACPECGCEDIADGSEGLFHCRKCWYVGPGWKFNTGRRR
ncbi:MAG: hypothetical protein IK093_05615 [Ruminiclostridium sp.]|nr:hypothetical protein [Ruminiclostridium sp.]